jgi:hypothetical protein
MPSEGNGPAGSAGHPDATYNTPEIEWLYDSLSGHPMELVFHFGEEAATWEKPPETL